MFRKIISKETTPIFLLLLVSLFKEMVFSALVPIWHTPDEQAHFAQVAYFAERGKMPNQGFDLNNEILISEKLLGTERDERGNNKFTYHPEYNIEYTDILLGKYEPEIENIPLSARTQYVKYEAANYPPLYYWLAALGYKLTYNENLITRVYAGRFISILLFVGLVAVSYLFAKELFPENELLQISLPTLISFQPMLSFVSSGVTSDTLINFLFTVFLFFSILLVKYGLEKRIIILNILTIILIYFTKPQFIIALPIFLLALVMGFFLHRKTRQSIKISIGVVTLILLISTLFLSTNQDFYKLIQKFYPQSFFPGNPEHLAEPIGFIRLTLSRTLHETIPWYWGVFKWLGVVLPIEILRLINRFLLLVGLGIILKLGLMFKKRTMTDYLFLFLIIVSCLYFGAIVIYDYIVYSAVNFSFGIQGRYFFPFIIAHFSVIIIALTGLIPKKWPGGKNLLLLLVNYLAIALNFIVIYLLAQSYYDVSNFNTFMIQASQYKPSYFKDGWLIFWFISYTLTLLMFTFYLLLKGSGFNDRKSNLKPRG